MSRALRCDDCGAVGALSYGEGDDGHDKCEREKDADGDRDTAVKLLLIFLVCVHIHNLFFPFCLAAVTIYIFAAFSIVIHLKAKKEKINLRQGARLCFCTREGHLTLFFIYVII